MKKFCLSALLILCCTFLSQAQTGLPVDDVQGNTLKKISIKIQAIEKKVSTASNIILTAMSGDVTNTMDEIVRQNEIFEDSRVLRNTLGDAVIVSKAYKTFRIQASSTQNSIKRVKMKLEEAEQSGALDAATIRQVNASLSRIRYSLTEAADLWKAATDLSDQIDRIIRLEKMQRAEAIIFDIERKTVPSIIAEMDALIYERLSKPRELSYMLPPESQSLLVTSTTRGGYVSGFSSEIGSIKDLWGEGLEKGRMREILELVFGYGEIMAGLIFTISLWYIIRSRDSGKMEAVIRNITVMLIAITFLKVISYNII